MFVDGMASDQLPEEDLRGVLKDLLSYGVPDHSTKVPYIEPADSPYTAMRGAVDSAGREMNSRTVVSRYYLQVEE